MLCVHVVCCTSRILCVGTYTAVAVITVLFPKGDECSILSVNFRKGVYVYAFKSKIFTPGMLLCFTCILIRITSTVEMLYIPGETTCT